MRKAAFLLLLGPVCLAQTPAVPGLGWIAREEPGRYQRVTGIAGAAMLDIEAEVAPGRLVAIRPGSAMALSVSEEGLAGLVRLEAEGEETPWQPLEGALENPALAVWSPSGDTLLLAGGGRLQVWSFEGDAPALAREFALDAMTAAISDGGSRVLARTEEALYLFEDNGGILEVARQPVEAFSFFAGGGRFAWIEGSALRIGGGETAPEWIELGDTAEGSLRLLASAAGKLLLAETSGGQSHLRLWNLEGALEREWLVPGEVAALQPTGAAGVLRLATRGAGPVWIADLGAVEPSVFFVPRGEGQARQGGEQ